MEIIKDIKIHLYKDLIEGKSNLKLLHKLILKKSIEMCNLAEAESEDYKEYKQNLEHKLKLLR